MLVSSYHIGENIKWLLFYIANNYLAFQLKRIY